MRFQSTYTRPVYWYDRVRQRERIVGWVLHDLPNQPDFYAALSPLSFRCAAYLQLTMRFPPKQPRQASSDLFPCLQEVLT